MNRETLIKRVQASHARSAWRRGVRAYAVMILDNCDDLDELPDDPAELEEVLLSGALDWREYSYNGYALIYDDDIARRLCNPSELRKTREGARQPNARENWCDVQARALYQAFEIIKDCQAHEVMED